MTNSFCHRLRSGFFENFKGPRNRILRIIHVRSVFCPIRVYTSLHFPPIFLGKLVLFLSVLSVFSLCSVF